MKGKKNQGRCTLPTNLESTTPHGDMPNFTEQGLQDALTQAESAVAWNHHLNRWIHHSIGSDYGRLTWEAMTTSLLVEWRHGVTCIEGQSRFEGLGTCAGGWPRAHVFILLQLAWILQPLQRGGSCHALTHSRCLCRVDWEVRKKGTGDVFDPLKNLLYLCTWANPWVLDHHNWWVEYPQFQRLRREWQNRRCPESMRLDRIDDRPKPDLLQEEEEEEVDHHLPLWIAREEQIQMIILWPASQVKATGIGDASGQREDWHRQDWTYPYFVLWMWMLMWPMKYGASMYKAGWISMMKRVCAPTSLVAYKVILGNGLVPYQEVWTST